MDGRVEILRVHSRRKTLGSDVDLNTNARRTPGFSGADRKILISSGEHCIESHPYLCPRLMHVPSRPATI